MNSEVNRRRVKLPQHPAPFSLSVCLSLFLYLRLEVKGVESEVTGNGTLGEKGAAVRVGESIGCV